MRIQARANPDPVNATKPQAAMPLKPLSGSDFADQLDAATSGRESKSDAAKPMPSRLRSALPKLSRLSSALSVRARIIVLAIIPVIGFGAVGFSYLSSERAVEMWAKYSHMFRGGGGGLS